MITRANNKKIPCILLCIAIMLHTPVNTIPVNAEGIRKATGGISSLISSLHKQLHLSSKPPKYTQISKPPLPLPKKVKNSSSEDIYDSVAITPSDESTPIAPLPGGSIPAVQPSRTAAQSVQRIRKPTAIPPPPPLPKSSPPLPPKPSLLATRPATLPTAHHLPETSHTTTRPSHLPLAPPLALDSPLPSPPLPSPPHLPVPQVSQHSAQPSHTAHLPSHSTHPSIPPNNPSNDSVLEMDDSTSSTKYNTDTDLDISNLGRSSYSTTNSSNGKIKKYPTGLDKGFIPYMNNVTKTTYQKTRFDIPDTTNDVFTLQNITMDRVVLTMDQWKEFKSTLKLDDTVGQEVVRIARKIGVLLGDIAHHRHCITSKLAANQITSTRCNEYSVLWHAVQDCCMCIEAHCLEIAQVQAECIAEILGNHLTSSKTLIKDDSLILELLQTTHLKEPKIKSLVSLKVATNALYRVLKETNSIYKISKALHYTCTPANVKLFSIQADICRKIYQTAENIVSNIHCVKDTHNSARKKTIPIKRAENNLCAIKGMYAREKDILTFIFMGQFMLQSIHRVKAYGGINNLQSVESTIKKILLAKDSKLYYMVFPEEPHEKDVFTKLGQSLMFDENAKITLKECMYVAQEYFTRLCESVKTSKSDLIKTAACIFIGMSEHAVDAHCGTVRDLEINQSWIITTELARSFCSLPNEYGNILQEYYTSKFKPMLNDNVIAPIRSLKSVGIVHQYYSNPIMNLINEYISGMPTVIYNVQCATDTQQLNNAIVMWAAYHEMLAVLASLYERRKALPSKMKGYTLGSTFEPVPFVGCVPVFPVESYAHSTGINDEHVRYYQETYGPRGSIRGY